MASIADGAICVVLPKPDCVGLLELQREGDPPRSGTFPARPLADDGGSLVAPQDPLDLLSASVIFPSKPSVEDDNLQSSPDDAVLAQVSNGIFL